MPIFAALLMKDPDRRLGAGPNDAIDIMDHAFFSSINWLDLRQKKISPPFQPEIRSEMDTRYFDSRFTNDSVELTPPDQNLSSPELKFIAGEQEKFPQFSYENSNFTTTPTDTHISTTL